MTPIEKLIPLQEKICRSTANKFKNSENHTELFSYENLILVSNELLCIINTKIEQNQLDEKGMYNYFRQSFSYKCQDLYRGSKRLKRNFSIVNKDINEISITSDKDPSIEQTLIRKDLLQDISKKISFLEGIDKKRYPLLLVFNLIKDGYSYEEISKQINLTERTIKSIKNKILIFLANEYQNEYLFNEPFDNSTVIYTEPKIDPVSETIYSIETNYKCNDNFARIQLCKRENENNIIIEEHFCKSEKYYDEKYNYLKKKLIDLN